MNAQQLLDHIITPTLKYMGGNYCTDNARMLLLATAAIESKCGYYIKQVGGPALGIWQMEPATHSDIWANCDALADHEDNEFRNFIGGLQIPEGSSGGYNNLLISPMYACAMARLKYSMDAAPLPDHNNILAMYTYYKRIYNTPLGASTYAKFEAAYIACGLDEVTL